MASDKNKEKSGGEVLLEKIGFSVKNCWETLAADERDKVFKFAEDYKSFLDSAKTEREFTTQAMAILKNNGFKDVDEALAKGDVIAAGDKVVQNVRDKAVIFAIVGSRPMTEGFNILGAHIDSPRIDLKTNPLYEDTGLAFMDTHYYGGIKHYQWSTIPLAIHGIVIKKNGEKCTVVVGENESDCVFTVTDLLPHLAREQMDKKASEFVGGEELDLLVGSEPYIDEKVEDKVKLGVLNILYEKYGIKEEDFASAEFEVVPAHKARDLGFDRSMIGAYGHDDRCCAYTSFAAALLIAGNKSPPERTAICVLEDKEEIGSYGNTGSQSKNFENFVSYLLALREGSEKALSAGFDIDRRLALSRSYMLSSDVNAAFDPGFAGVFDKKTASHFGKGLAISKYTGRGGKVGGSDANAEFCRRVLNTLDKNGVRWQYGNLGKVDKGGGGTIALHFAGLGIEVLDCGIPVLSMHSPFEVISKIDLYTAFRGYTAFLGENSG
ncbi:MAG: aminopeptidase [Candidatus Accumulibacter sp.]|jgi:aspartyl aminopeptidase|nr:aminopeptidase [Accumulibacter sp.]